MRSAILDKKQATQDWDEGSDPLAPLSGDDTSQSRLDAILDYIRTRFSGLKAKLIFPYLFLTLLTAMIGTFVVTRLVASSVRERFFNQMYEARRVAADGIVRREQDHLANLRLMAFTEGVAEAFVEENAQTLQDLLWPLALNNDVEAVTAINLEGMEIMTLAQDPEIGRFGIYTGTDFSTFDIVNQVIDYEIDDLGDKYAGLLITRFGPYLYTSAPVRNSSNQLVGVLMIGTRLESLLADLKTQALADMILLSENGTLLSSTFSNAAEARELLELDAREIPEMGETYTNDFKLSKRSYQAAYAPVVIRSENMGVLGVALPSNYVVDTEATSRNTFSLIFSLATLSVIVIGYVLSQSIARPILKLRSVSKAVAEGDLNQRTGFHRSDEIGELAEVFDLMTFRLRKRTAQAARLYQETLERNDELGVINARLQEAQQQLIQSEKLAAVGQLTAGIVHDVKNPLAVIKGMAEELQEDDELTPEANEQLIIIRDNATRATRIVADLLKFARQSTPQLKRQNINETIRTAIRLTDYLARKGRVEVQTELLPDPVNVMYDATQIEQVIVNLIQNAIQAMPDGGILTISLTRTGQAIAIEVKDTGVGIPEEYLNRIFDPFFTTKPEGEGTGLGLSVSYGIVSSHRGRIDVSSIEGVGTTFTVLLPQEQQMGEL
ncbi:MAG: HAMP domain-containing protein [Anaerolineales bacterium]|nr:HAMP domain-containing protein [Anaerolineales bacterium]